MLMDSASCKPRFSTLGKDTRTSPQVLLAAESYNPTDTACDLDSTYGAGMGGRLYRWPLGSDSRLAEGRRFRAFRVFRGFYCDNSHSQATH
ncbi:MAG TPA: hypothetical protein VJ302_16000 [Blastocatellia bacterium]|nr:hypothetical protein [Blastocatellia bacterium]